MKINLQTVLLIITVIVIIIMGMVIIKTIKEVEILEEENKKMQQKIEILEQQQNTQTKPNETSNTVNSAEIGKNEIEELVKQYVKAVNNKNWTFIEKYTSAEMIEHMKKFEISNMVIDYNSYEEDELGSYYTVSFSVNSTQAEENDYENGNNNRRYFIINKENNKYIIEPIATGI